MVRRKLKALNYHDTKTFNIDDEKHYRSLILWLEDQKIRHYPISDRKDLKDIHSENWPKTYDKYCSDVECPLKANDKPQRLEWLLSFAVRLEYTDELDKYKNITCASALNSKSCEPVVKSTNPLDALDFRSEEYKKEINKLAGSIKVSPHPDPLVTTEAVCKVIVQNISSNISKETEGGVGFPVLESGEGLELGDRVLSEAARVLRLLYIHNLRDLQTSINEIIVAVQTVTADPRTDTRLGKVGF